MPQGSTFYSEERMIAAFLERVETHGLCWVWTGGKTIAGYGSCYMNGEYEKAHRVSYRLNKGPIPEDMIVMHTCDNPSCVNPVHLKIGTQKDNMQDMIKKGRRRLGGDRVYTSKVRGNIG